MSWLKRYRMKALCKKFREPMIRAKMYGIVAYWKHATYAPGSKAMKAAEERFINLSITCPSAE